MPVSSHFLIPAHRNLRLLCVEDDPVCRDILMAAFARPGLSVEIVNDGQEALERFVAEAEGFDLLVTDHRMPRIDGVELVRRVRAEGYAGAIVVVSAFDSPELQALYHPLGVRHFLSKPTTVGALRAVVAAVSTGAPPISRAG